MKLLLGVLAMILMTTLITSCKDKVNSQNNKTVKYIVEAAGRSLVCNNLKRATYGTYTLTDCTCFLTGIKIKTVMGATNVLEYVE